MSIATDALGAKKNQADAAYNICRRRVIKSIVYLAILSIIPVLLNISGLKFINPFLGMLTALGLITILSSPSLIWAILGISAASDKVTPTEALRKLQSVLYSALFVSTVFLFILSTFQIDRNWEAIPVIYLGIFVLFLFDAVLNIKTKISSKLLFLYTIVYLLLSIGSLISGVAYNKVIGIDPYYFFRTTEVDELLYKVQVKKSEAEQTDEVKKLNEILAKGKLTSDDLLYIEKLRKKHTVPGMIGNWAKGERGPETISYKAGDKLPYFIKEGELSDHWIRRNHTKTSTRIRGDGEIRLVARSSGKMITLNEFGKDGLEDDFRILAIKQASGTVTFGKR